LGEAFISSFESRSNIGKINVLKRSGMFDLAKFKEYLRLTLRKHNT
jgi:hypothetical protein